MTLNRSIAYALVLVLPVACNTSTTSHETPAAESASAPVAQASASPPPSASARPERHGREQGGPAGTMFRAARELDLSDAQKATLDTLETQRESLELPNDEFKDLQADLVTGIRAGKLDGTKLQADYAAIDKSIGARQAREEAAVSGLYAALDATQRKALVASVRTKQAARDAQMEAHMNVDAGVGDWEKRRLGRLTEQLGLDAGQQKSVGAILAKADAADPSSPGAMRAMGKEGEKRMEAVLAAFEGASFDPKKLDLTGAPGKTPHEGVEKDATFLAQLLPILTPEQREKLAAQRERSGLRRHPDGRGPGMMGGPGMRGPGMGPGSMPGAGAPGTGAP